MSLDFEVGGARRGFCERSSSPRGKMTDLCTDQVVGAEKVQENGAPGNNIGRDAFNVS